jgi:hypothetical protein
VCLFGSSLDRRLTPVPKWPRLLVWAFFFGLFGRYLFVLLGNWQERQVWVAVALSMMSAFAALMWQTLAEKA